jgi:hypothetical protein
MNRTRLRVIVSCLLTLCWSGDFATASAQAQPAAVETIRLTSQFLERAQYNPTTRALTIDFDDGSSYRYADVPADVFARLRAAAAAPDTFFMSSIRKSFRYTKLKSASKNVPHAKRRRKKAKKAKPKPAAASDRFACPSLTAMRRQNVVSGAFDSVAYDASTKCMVVHFSKRGTYAYGNVPDSVYRRMLQARPDPGEYFNESVRGKYPTRRLMK